MAQHHVSLPKLKISREAALPLGLMPGALTAVLIGVLSHSLLLGVMLFGPLAVVSSILVERLSSGDGHTPQPGF